MVNTTCPIPSSLLAPEVSGPFNVVPKRHSYFNDPIDRHAGRLRGNTRRWGDADIQTQREVIRTVLEEANARKLSASETAFVLALIRNESGFNPDAASAVSSAAGLGQFIKQTGAAYGIGDDNRFSVREQISSIIRHLQDLVRGYLGEASGETEDFALLYALYHDGPRLNHGGLLIARNKVIPWMMRIRDWLLGC